MSSPATCSLCLTAIQAGEHDVYCPGCQAVYHEDCWVENGGCGVYGCKEAPEVKPREGLEIPVSHWGKEEKNCPSCGFTIQAAAVRCRQCGATFEAGLHEATAFRQKQAQQDRLPGVKRGAIVISVLCFLPCTAPLGLIIGGIWLAVRRRDLRALPAFFGSMVYIAIACAALLTIFITIAAFFYGASHTTPDHLP